MMLINGALHVSAVPLPSAQLGYVRPWRVSSPPGLWKYSLLITVLEQSTNGTENVLVMTDVFSKFTMAASTRDQTADTTANVLQKSSRSGECTYCVLRHEFKKEVCPAFGKKCRNCSTSDHFAKKCLHKPYHSGVGSQGGRSATD